MTADLPNVECVVKALTKARIDLSNEKAAQSQIADVLTGAGIAFERECRLSAFDVPDFMLPDGLAIEVKLRGARKMAVFRQLGRYAAHDRVTGLLLVTNFAMGLPAEIDGKPTYFLSLGRSWL